MENFSVLVIFITGAIVGVTFGGAVMLITLTSTPGIYDRLVSYSVSDKEEYCNNYAQMMDFRIPLNPDQAVDIGIANAMCACRWEEWPDNKMYKGITRCEVR